MTSKTRPVFPHRVRGTVVAVLLASTVLTGTALVSNSLPVNAAPAANLDTAATALPGSFAPLVKTVTPAVVTIMAAAGGPERVPPSVEPGSPLEEFFRRFQQQGIPGFGKPQEERRGASLGSGFIIDAEGHIVTNNHVVEGARKVTVTLHDGTELAAEVVGTDSKTDLALLKVSADKPLPYLRFGDSDRAEVGDWVIAVGNPFGLGGTVTTGIVSARGRAIDAGPYDDFIQTDAAINRGNSGGPMFNAAGEVIGINTAIFSPTGGSVGIGFAIPSNLARTVVTQLKDHGHVDRGWLGVSIQAVTPDIAEGLGLEKAEGAIVAKVIPDSPADRAGLQVGDVILGYAGQPVDTSRTLTRKVADTRAGDKVELRVMRDGRERTLTVAIGTLKEEPHRRA